MSVMKAANLKKTIEYLRRNGLKHTWNAARERMEQVRGDRYEWQEPSLLEIRAGKEYSRELIGEAESSGGTAPRFSILVPAYRTNPDFLRELAESVKAQTYPYWELLILDASGDGAVRDTLKEFCIVKGIAFSEEKEQRKAQAGRAENAADEGAGLWQAGRIRCVALCENRGIAENTNAGLWLAQGDYIGLLDHDDVLTADALQCMAEAILESGRDCAARLLYSDEDKWNGEKNGYYEPNFKEDFNLDLLLSNNYICHFLVMEAALMRELGLRGEYDGAQDYDLVLRAAERILRESGGILHIPRVLYHWRCHSASTAENPRSKAYAYEAGRRALQDFADRLGLTARAVDLRHVGFYRLEYLGRGEESSAGAAESPSAGAGKGKVQKAGPRTILEQRPDLAAVGGRVLAGKHSGRTGAEREPAPDAQIREGSLIGGRMDREGNVFYYGLKPGYSGYLHRAVLTQDAEAVDLRCICVAKEYQKLFEEVVGVPYVIRPGGDWFDSDTLPADADVLQLSLKLCAALRERGKRLLWDPEQGWTLPGRSGAAKGHSDR